MIEQVIVAALTLGLAVWIVRPLLGKAPASPGPAGATTTASDARNDLLEAKQSVYRSLIDLELDHKLGKLAEEDYAALLQEGKHEALSLIEQLEGSEPAQAPEMTLEEEIRAARARLRKE